MAQTTTATLPDFVKLWNFSDPAGTEAKFRELLPAAESSGDDNYHAELLTQIARTQSLRGSFDRAHQILDEVNVMLARNPTLKSRKSYLRYLLERGRSFNSANRQSEAIPLFQKAYHAGVEQNEMRLAIDAVHMIAIAERDPKEQVAWNLKGIALAQETGESGWLNALYNNIGESYLALQDYANARKYFHLLAELQKQSHGKPDIYTLKDEAKATRLLGKPEEALEIIQPVAEQLVSENTMDGWIAEELAESLAALGKESEAKPHFLTAYDILSRDEWVKKNEPQKLVRLKQMSE